MDECTRGGASDKAENAKATSSSTQVWENGGSHAFYGRRRGRFRAWRRPRAHRAVQTRAVRRGSPRPSDPTACAVDGRVIGRPRPSDRSVGAVRSVARGRPLIRFSPLPPLRSPLPLQTLTPPNSTSLNFLEHSFLGWFTLHVKSIISKNCHVHYWSEECRKDLNRRHADIPYPISCVCGSI